MLTAMTDSENPDEPDPRSHRLPTGSHHDRSRDERIAEATAMIALWERAVFRGRPDAREQLAFWRGVLAELGEENEPGGRLSGPRPVRRFRRRPHDRRRDSTKNETGRVVGPARFRASLVAGVGIEPT